MTTTIGIAAHELQDLQQALESGAWVPSEPELVCAATILDATGTLVPTEAILRGFHVAGPDVAPPGEARFAQVLMRCSIVLRPSAALDSQDGQRLVALLGSLLRDLREARG